MMRKDLFSKTPIANVYAFIMFCLAKCCAFAGVALGFIPSLWVLGAVLLAFSLILLTASVVVCIQEMKRQNALEEAAKKEEMEERGLIQKMIEDGTLFRQMRQAGYQVEKKNNISNYLNVN